MSMKIISAMLFLLGFVSCAKNYKEPTKGIDGRGITPLFFFVTSNSTCSPAENVNGKNFRPEEIMDKYPECFLEKFNSEGSYILDCKSSKLATSFYYSNTEEKCKKFAETYKK